MGQGGVRGKDFHDGAGLRGNPHKSLRVGEENFTGEEGKDSWEGFQAPGWWSAALNSLSHDVVSLPVTFLPIGYIVLRSTDRC